MKQRLKRLIERWRLRRQLTGRELTPAEIERRQPLWDALGNLYLDSQSDYFVPFLVRTAREGNFDLAEVSHILRWEVRPVLYMNYLSITGEWQYWDADWLYEEILKMMAKCPPLILTQNNFMPEEWPEIQAALSSSSTG